MGNSQTRGRNRYNNDNPTGDNNRYTTDPRGGPSILSPQMNGYYTKPDGSKSNAPDAKKRNSDPVTTPKRKGGKNPFMRSLG